MRLADFDFELPDTLIALRPAVPRDRARLLHVAGDGARTDYHVSDLPRLLRRGDALIINNTKVLPVRLKAERARSKQNTRAQIELTLLKPLSESTWTCFLRPAKRVLVGDMLYFGDDIAARVSARDGGTATLDFRAMSIDIATLFERFGTMPLPPYIAARRAPDARDIDDYQTLFARHIGAVAAPTAGLHFTPALFDACRAGGVSVHEITLHVGAGTFLPVKSETLEGHIMHAEYGEISAATADALNAVRAQGGRIIAVGTTCTRLLEAAAQGSGSVAAFRGETDIFIKPGYDFNVVDLMMTNFHLPRSTLFMLVAAFSGLLTMRAAYTHAIAQNYRFYSYGDACLLEAAAFAKDKL